MTPTLCSTCGTLVPGDVCPHCSAPLAASSRRGIAPAVALLGLSLLAGGCQTTHALYGVEVSDNDNDGYFEGEDCDDNDPDIHPGAEETAGDGVDSNCDGQDDPQA